MRILVTGDLHLTDNKPKNRVDNYVNTQEGKIEQIYQIAVDNDVEYIIQPGDFCDNHDAPDKFKTRWISILKKFPKIITIAGQHDLRYHTSSILNTPLGVLKEALNFSIACEEPIIIGNIPYINVYGAPWGKEVPVIKHESKYNILVTHRLITEGEMWPGQEKYEVAGTFLRKHKFNLIISGDNHNSFYNIHKDKKLINCGSLMRNRIDQSRHRPCVWIVDFSSSILTFKQHLLKVEDFGLVFNLEEAEKDSNKCKKLEELAATLKSGSKLKGLDYKKRVMEEVSRLKSINKLNKTTEEIIEEVMDG